MCLLQGLPDRVNSLLAKPARENSQFSKIDATLFVFDTISTQGALTCLFQTFRLHEDCVKAQKQVSKLRLLPTVKLRYSCCFSEHFGKHQVQL